MKRIGIIDSDTHGYLDTIDLALDATMDQDIDMWLHHRDYGDHSAVYCKRAPMCRSMPCAAIMTACSTVRALGEQLIPLEDTYIYMTHGHEVSYCKRA